MKVLIIEDNKGDFILVQEYLLEAFPSAAIIHAEFLAAALLVLETQQVDVILLDLSLPDSNGDQSINKIKLITNEPPIIVLTGSNDKQTGINSLRLGVQDYLIKDEINETVLQKSISYSIERKLNQQQLEQNEKRFRALIENSTEGLAVLKATGEVTEMSQPALKILGLPVNTILNIALADFIHPDDITKVSSAFNGIVNEFNKVRSLQFRVKKANGNYIWLDTYFHNLLHEAAVNAIVVNFRDITIKMQYDQERIALINELTASNNDLKQYTFLATHNLRAPLTNLLSIINLLDWNEIEDETNLMLLKAFKESTLQLNDTLNDMIEIILIKKMENLALKDLALKEIFNKVMATYHLRMEAVGAVIEVNFTEEPIVNFDEVCMENIFSNLIGNALKYAAANRKLVLKICTRNFDGATQLIFSDNGTGMDMTQIKDKIFGLYQRFHHNSESKGIGLYLVKSQLNALGGGIDVQAAIDEGTTFTLTFKKPNV